MLWTCVTHNTAMLHFSSHREGTEWLGHMSLHLSLEVLPLWQYVKSSAFFGSDTTCCCLIFGHCHLGGSTTALWFWLVFLCWSMTITIFSCPYWLPVHHLPTNAQSDLSSTLFFVLLFPFCGTWDWTWSLKHIRQLRGIVFYDLRTLFNFNCVVYITEL